MSLGIWIFIAAILIVIMIHESGHFFVAKAFNFKATRYFIGFGPTIWSTHRGETEYGVKAFPLGGFVKIVGMNPYEEIPPEDQPRSYPNKPAWQRALVIVAGSATHFVVAFVVLFVAAMTIGFPGDRATNRIAALETSVEGEETPAAAAGFRRGDRIVAVGGRATESWEEIRTYIRARGGERGVFTVERNGERLEITAQLGTALFDEEGRLVEYASFGESLRTPSPGEEMVGFLGVGPEANLETTGPGRALITAGERTWETTYLSFRGIGRVGQIVFGGELWRALVGEGERDPGGVVGIIGAGRIAGESVEAGRPLDLVGLIVGFTIFIGIMNLLPLPPLDGGHLAVIAYEAVTGRTVDVRKLIPIAAAVISFFVLLFMAVIYLDLARPIRVPL